jgi:hypothetical protein
MLTQRTISGFDPTIDVPSDVRAECASIHGQIGDLFSTGHPLDVPRFVISEIKATTKRGSNRTFAQVCKKVFKDHPAVADHDALTTVVVVSNVAGVSASGFHVLPRFVSSAWSLSKGMTMRWAASFWHAATTVTVKKPIGWLGDGLTTTAFAKFHGGIIPHAT